MHPTTRLAVSAALLLVLLATGCKPRPGESKPDPNPRPPEREASAEEAPRPTTRRPGDASLADALGDLVEAARNPRPVYRVPLDHLFLGLPPRETPPLLAPGDTLGWARLNHHLNGRSELLGGAGPQRFGFAVELRDVLFEATDDGKFTPTFVFGPGEADRLHGTLHGAPAVVRIIGGAYHSSSRCSWRFDPVGGARAEALRKFIGSKVRIVVSASRAEAVAMEGDRPGRSGCFLTLFADALSVDLPEEEQAPDEAEPGLPVGRFEEGDQVQCLRCVETFVLAEDVTLLSDRAGGYQLVKCPKCRNSVVFQAPSR